MARSKVAGDEIKTFLSEPQSSGELQTMRNDAVLLLSDQSEAFCREIVLFGRIPSLAYELAFAFKDEMTGQMIKPEAASYRAAQLLRTPEVVERIKELRNEILEWHKTPREEVLMQLRSIALDPDAKHSDKLAALKQLAAAEGYNVEKELPQGASIVINMPFAVKQLGQPTGEVIDVESSGNISLLDSPPDSQG